MGRNFFHCSSRFVLTKLFYALQEITLGTFWGFVTVRSPPPPTHTHPEQTDRHPPWTGIPLGTPAWTHPPGQTTPWADTPPPPGDGHCSRRYASYWNAILFIEIIAYCSDGSTIFHRWWPTPEEVRQPIITARNEVGARLCFYRCVWFCSRGGVCIPECLAGHMTNQHYISSCSVGGSQLVRRQHTGNIKCMMG